LKIRVKMTFRISQFAAACGVSLLAFPGLVVAQAPRYQSPLTSATTASTSPTTYQTPAPITPNATVVEDVIARVNDQIITRSDLDRANQQLAEEIQRNNVPPSDAAEEQKNLLRDMIDKQLLLSRAKELGMNADNEVIRQLDEIRKQYKLASMEELERAARQQGISFEDFKADIRDKILTQEVVRDEVGRKLQMTQGQEQAFYEKNKDQFAQPEQVRLSEILIPLPADAKDDAIAQAQAKANDVAAKVKAGGKFDDLAKQFSGGPTASDGGDLGFFKRGALAKVMEDQTFALTPGGSTAPIRTRQGFVILKVTEHQQAGVPAMKDIEPQIQEAMYAEALQPALRAYLTKLREDAYVDIKSGLVDTGASPRQTKPVFTATAPPQVKKTKKEVEKQRFDRGTRFSTEKKAAAPVTTATAPVPAPLGSSAAGATGGTAVPALPTADATGIGATTNAATTTTASAGTAVAAKTVKTANANTKEVKPKKPKTEKVRFGQAPRNALPTTPTDLAEDHGLGRGDSPDGPGGQAAPGAAMAPTETASHFTASSDPDPLAAKPVVTGKTRYTARIKTEAADKAAAKVTKEKDKAKETPIAATAEENAATKVQAAPLGVNGDTSKKKKPEKVPGAPKERLQDQPKAAPTPPQEPTPYRAPTPDTSTAPAGSTTTPATTTTPTTAPATK
jgi:peptidyl-prolyl cis-trans isomerase SurA